MVKITSLLSSSSILLCMSLAPGASAQQITGAPGSPSATMTLDGKQLPPEPPKFGGEIKEEAKDSKPYWPPSVVPPKGAPNVLLIMTDDQGYGVSGTFGGVINSSGPLVVSMSLFDDNESYYGGAIYSTGATTIQDS